MAKKKKKARQLSQREKRRLRLQQIIFVAIAFIVIASFVVSLIS